MVDPGTYPSGLLDRRQALRRLGGLGLGTLLAGFERGEEAPAQPEPPNFLFIMGDDHATRALSCYGSDVIQTPHLDRLAIEGTRFENFLVTNSLCAPTRGSMLTGTYAHKHGKVDNKSSTPFDGGAVTFPELLQSAGYATAFVGKWHLQTRPRGFDYWIKLPRQGRYVDPVFDEQGDTRQFEGYVSDVITDLTLGKLDELEKQEKPFCLFCWHKAAHRPFDPPGRYEDYFSDASIPPPRTLHDDYSDRASPARKANMRLYGSPNSSNSPFRFDDDLPPALAPREKEREAYEAFMRAYLGAVQSLDDSVGSLLEQLDTSGLAETTLVAYTSDNGFFMGEHGWLDKRFMYEESLHVPLLVRYPQAVLAGDTVDEITLDIDLAETFLDYAGLAIPSHMQGRSLRPLLERGSAKGWRTSMYYHFYENYGPHNVAAHVGVRSERYKLIYYYREGSQTRGSNMSAWELFDLQEDPHELHNVYGEPGYDSLARSMKKELRRLITFYEDDRAPVAIRTDSDGASAAPATFTLEEPSPNPFARATSLALELPEAMTVSAAVYDVLGQKVETLHRSATLPPGRHRLSWNGHVQGAPAPVGTYFIRVTTSEDTRTRTVTLVR